MNVFQRAYNWLTERKTPLWLVQILDRLEVVIVIALKIVGDDALDFLKTQIFAQMQSDIPGAEKLQIVIGNFRSKYSWIKVSSSTLNLLCELVLAELKEMMEDR